MNHNLRYRISSLEQLPKCLSNKSQKLRIVYSKYINSDVLCGEKISIEHDIFGTLFTYVVDARGSLVNDVKEISVNELLSHLYKYGFEIEYRPAKHLSGNQIQYLMTLDDLGFDKLRVVGDDLHPIVVAFVTSANPEWIHDRYLPSDREVKQSLLSGTAINISAISESNNYDWSWLDFVANITDILNDNK